MSGPNTPVASRLIEYEVSPHIASILSEVLAVTPIGQHEAIRDYIERVGDLLVARALDEAHIVTAVDDPGLFAERGQDDTLSAWKAKAVRAVILNGNDYRDPAYLERMASYRA